MARQTLRVPSFLLFSHIGMKRFNGFRKEVSGSFSGVMCMKDAHHMSAAVLGCRFSSPAWGSFGSLTTSSVVGQRI